MNKEALLKKALVLQHDHKDCGAACLLMAIKWYGYHDALEHIRVLSGTNGDGVSLLGLQQAAIEVGFNAEAFKASLHDLELIPELCILHVTKKGAFNHFVLCLGKENGKWLIADPDDGVKTYTDKQLMKEWEQGIFLRLEKPTKLNLEKRRRHLFKGWVLPLFEKHRTRLILIVGLGIIHAILLFTTAIFTERLVDELLPSQDKSLIVKSILLWAFLLLLALGVSYLRNYSLAIFSREVNASLIKEFFGKLLYLPKPFFDSKKTGDLVVRLEDVEDIEESASKWIEDGFISLLVVLVALGLLFIYSTQIALINSVLLPLLFGVILLLKGRIKKSQRQAMASHAANNANYIDAITGMNTIKLRQAEVRFTKHALKLYRSFRNKVFRAERVNMDFGLLVQLLAISITIAVIAISSIQVLYGSLQMGNFLAIISITSIASINTTNLAYAYIDFEQARISFERMHELVGQRTEDVSDPGPLLLRSKNSLFIKSVSFSFPGQAELLKSVSMQLDSGKICVLLGEIGSGKSTLLNVISTLYQPDQGVIMFNDQNVHEFPTNWRRVIGLVPQETKIFNTTFWQNVGVKSIGEENDMARTRVEHLIDQHGFGPIVDALPLGIDTVLGENGVKLSGGQKRILGLMRALYTKPSVLLLDEVTTSLDQNCLNLVTEILKKAKLSMPILQITHSPVVASQADYVYLLEKGKTEVHGTPDQLLERDNFFSQFFEKGIYSRIKKASA
ncbi:ABC transporter transmembrane domain-containing protein [Roseivirga sp. E12]|uniref:peptidase domain-containing ABC transporter n=1 Tax=Roseivirga sp. E12 TaxID=2819237 RepID=UPI001ABC6625|nr:ATP-binding cassette domain-containing protein [Roseivirga sp. E12]